MLNSTRELGLSNEHGGIFILPEDTPIGSKLADHIKDDIILEADITPNRAHDCLSMVGIAREVSAILGMEMSEVPASELPKISDELDGVSLGDVEHTPSYQLITFEDVKEASTPLWMTIRLMAMDADSIFPIVDISNYALFEYGNPSHAFDMTKISKGTINVSMGNKERILLLSEEEERQVSSDNLLVKNNDTPIALAGVKGGQRTAISKETKCIALEVATFDQAIIQQSAKSANLISDASARYNKGIPAELGDVTAQRIAYLIKDILGASPVARIKKESNIQAPEAIVVKKDRAEKIAGSPINIEEAEVHLIRLGCEVESIDDTSWKVTPPYTRPDIAGEHDVVEEIIRMQDISNIPTRALKEATKVTIAPQSIIEFIMRRSLAEKGFTETYNYSFDVEHASVLLKEDKKDFVEIVNPPAQHQHALRKSLIPGLLHHVAINKSAFERKIKPEKPALFELGHVYKVGENGVVPGIEEHASIAWIANADIELIEETVREVLHAIGVDNVELNGNSEEKSLSVNAKTIGKIITIPQSVGEKIKYTLTLSAVEINIDTLLTAINKEIKAPEEMLAVHVGEAVQYKGLAKYPSVFRDVSMLVGSDIAVETVQEIIERAGGDLVIDSELFDEYQPEGSEQTSLAFHIEYQSPEKTLTDEEVETSHNRIIKALEDIGATIR